MKIHRKRVKKKINGEKKKKIGQAAVIKNGAQTEKCTDQPRFPHNLPFLPTLLFVPPTPPAHSCGFAELCSFAPSTVWSALLSSWFTICKVLTSWNGNYVSFIYLFIFHDLLMFRAFELELNWNPEIPIAICKTNILTMKLVNHISFTSVLILLAVLQCLFQEPTFKVKLL